MPTTRPRPSASAPPELPGFSAASVWITLSTTRTADPARVGSERPSADTTPAVTEPPKPCGFPIATTSWPTRRRSASPSSAGASPSPCARRTARSESGSVPTISASNSRPSVNVARARSPPATTWAEVSANPSEVMTTPLPLPRSRPRRSTFSAATEGARRSATEITAREYASSAAASSASPAGSETNINRSMSGR
jgi:hypothetical protein